MANKKTSINLSIYDQLQQDFESCFVCILVLFNIINAVYKCIAESCYIHANPEMNCCKQVGTQNIEKYNTIHNVYI